MNEQQKEDRRRKAQELAKDIEDAVTEKRSSIELDTLRAECSKSVVQTVVLLLFDEPFYGHILTSTAKQIVVGNTTVLGRNIKSAAVYVTGTGMHMVVNADFWVTLSESEKKAIMKHEVLHLALRHVSRGNSYINTLGVWNKDKWDVSVDIVCNSYIEGLPEKCYTADFFGLEPKKTAEYYYNNIPEGDDNGNGKDGGDGRGVLDDHGLWGKEDVTEVMKDAIVSAAIENAIKAAGSVPGDLQDLLDKIMGPPKIAWQHHLRRFIIGAGDNMLDFSKKRVSKRYPPTRPGIRLKPRANIFIAVDVSGSISDEELKAFFREIDAIDRSQLCHLILAEFDTEIKMDSFQDPYKGGDKIYVHGRGGTMFAPIFDYVKDKNLYIEAIVVLTDGHNFDADELVKRKVSTPTLWIVTESGNMDQPFGKVIPLELDKG